MKILIGYDGSKESDRALAGLARAGLPAESEALVATVTNPWPDAGPEGMAWASFGLSAASIADRALREAQDVADKGARRLRKLFPAWRVRGEAIAGRPVQGLLGKAEAWKPDLVVLGSHGRGGLRRLALGSVSLRVLHHAKADVRISRHRPGPARAAPRILLALDGSPGADRALDALAARDWPAGTSVRVVAVVDWRELPFALLRPRNAGVREKARAALRTWIESKAEEAAGSLARKGLEADHSVLLGDPRHVLLKTAKAWKADGIFIGSRGLNAASRFLLGSVSTAVAAHAPCPVEVIRRARDSRGGKRR